MSNAATIAEGKAWSQYHNAPDSCRNAPGERWEVVLAGAGRPLILLTPFRSSDRPRNEARLAIENLASLVYFSPANIWELCIKSSLGKLLVLDPKKIAQALAKARIEELPIRCVHTRWIAGLPGHHADPFDRLLIAQAVEEKLTFCTRDPRIELYDVKILRA